MAPRETKSNALSHLVTNGDSQPALVDSVSWKGEVARFTASPNCGTMVHDVNFLITSPATIPVHSQRLIEEKEVGRPMERLGLERHLVTIFFLFSSTATLQGGSCFGRLAEQSPLTTSQHNGET